MDNWKKYRQSMDLAVCAGILLCLLIQIIRTGNLPGLYLDAINPDYIAVQMLFPREHQIHWMVARPWLCQVYHGCLTAVFAFLSILLTGTTSILQHHIVNGITASVCIIILYKFLVSKITGVNRFLAAAVSFMMATMPSLLTITFTQYYIELPETLCVLLSLLFYYKWVENFEKQNYLFFSFFTAGIAFYGYFNFLFFLPALLVGTGYHCWKEKKPLFLMVLHGMTGYFMGCGLYFIGYTQMWLAATHRDLAGQKRMLLLFAILYYLNLFVFSRLTRCSRWEKPGTIKLICLAGLIESPIVAFWVYKVLPVFGRYSSSLNIAGDAGGIGQRMFHIQKDMTAILSGRDGEALIYKDQVTKLTNLWWIFILVLTIVLLIFEFRTKEKSPRKSLWKSMAGILILYVIGCFAFATRMQTQHFVPILFLFGIILALQLKEFIYYLGNCRMKSLAVSVLLLFFISLNLVNSNKIIDEIQATGGRGAFTDQINEISYEALENHLQNRNQVYLFKDWGFLFGFNYLTKNQVMCVTDLNTEFLSQYVEQGYDLVACYWKEEDTPLYEEFFEKCQENVSEGKWKIERETRYQRDGEIAFYVMSMIME